MADEIELSVHIDNQQALMSLTELEVKAGEMSESVQQMQSGMTTQLPGYAEGMAFQYSQFQDNLQRLIDLRRSIDTASSSFDADRLTESFTRSLKTIENVYKDFTENFQFSKTIESNLSGMGDAVKNNLLSSLRELQPELIGELRKFAASATQAVGAQTDKSLLNMFAGSDAFKRLQRQLTQRTSAFGGSDDSSLHNLQTLAKLSMPFAVAQYNRQQIVDWFDKTNAPETFRQMLPKSFQTIPAYLKNTQLRQRGSNAAENRHLTNDEKKALESIITSDSFALDAAVSQGIARKHNGRIFLNEYTTREMINAMAGRVMHDIVNGAQGEARYGITDVEDPDVFYKIIRKNNKMLTGSLQTARVMNDRFGSWLNPGYYEASKGRFSEGGKDLGTVRFAPRIDTRAFAEYTLDEMKHGAQFDGQPVTEEGRPVRPEDYHQITLRDSIHHRKLRATQAGDNVEHNGFSRNAIYLKTPEEAYDYETSPERLKEIEKDLAERIENGYTVNGRHYSYVRHNATHAEFVLDDIIKELGGGDFEKGRNVFLNGAQRRYTDPVKFHKALDYQNKTATDSQRIADLYGSDLRGAKVVVSNLKELGMDGFNLISDEIVPASFQGRENEAAEKATYVKFNMAGLRKLYKDKIDSQGNLVIPKAAPGGQDLVIGPDVTMIEDQANIKNFDSLYRDKKGNLLPLEAINAARSQVMQRGDLSAKVTYEGANTEKRWLSHQMVQTLGPVFTPELRKYFMQNVFDELASLGDDETVRRKLFGGQNIDLNSPAAQQTIQDYRDSIFERISQGDLLGPEGGIQYGMAAPWVPSIVNKALKRAGVSLTKEQENAAIDENNVLFMNMLADTLGIVRAPYSAEGNIVAGNEAVKDNFKALVKTLGLDPNGLYMAPGAPMLSFMQTEDFDGDINAIMDLSGQGVSRNNPRFAAAMNKLMTDAQAWYQKNIVERSGRTQEEQEALKAQRTIQAANQPGAVFDMFDSKTNAHEIIEGAQAGQKMGLANAVDRNAWQYGVSQRVARAHRDSASHYDAVSTFLKERNNFDLTEDERKILSGGAPFAAMFKWINDALEDVDGNRMWTENSQAQFNKHNIDKVNLPSQKQGDIQAALYTRFLAHKQGFDINGKLNLDEIFAKLPEVDLNTATGRMTQQLRNIRRDMGKGLYVALSDSLAEETKLMSTMAYNEITRDVNQDSRFVTTSDKNKEIARRFREAGGEVAKNIDQFVVTESIARGNQDLRNELKQLSDLSGQHSVFGTSYGITFKEPEKVIEQNKRELERIDKENQEKQRRVDEIKAKQAGNGRRLISDTEYMIYDPNISKEQNIKERTEHFKKQGLSQEAIDKDAKAVSDLYDAIESGQIIVDDGKNSKFKVKNNGQWVNLANEEVEELKQLKTLTTEIGDNDERKAAIEQNIDLAENQISAAYNFIKAQERFNGIRSNVGQFTSGLYSSIAKKENELEGLSKADIYYNDKWNMANRLSKELDAFRESQEFAALSTDDQDTINRWLSKDNGLFALVDKDLAETTAFKTKRTLEQYQKKNVKHNGNAAILKDRFEAYDKDIENLIGYRDLLEERLAAGGFDDKTRDLFEKRLVESNKNITSAQGEVGRLKVSEATETLDKIKNTVINDPFQKLKQGAAEAKVQVSALVDVLAKVYKDQGLNDAEIEKKMKNYSTLTQQIDENAAFQKDVLDLQQRSKVRQILGTYSTDIDSYDLERQKAFLDFRQEQSRIAKKYNSGKLITDDERRLLSTSFAEYNRRFDERHLDVSSYLTGEDAVRHKASVNVDNANKIIERIRKSKLNKEEKELREDTIKRMFGDNYVDDQVAAYRIQQSMKDQRQLMQAERAEMQGQQMQRNWNMRGFSDPFSRRYMQRMSMYDQYRSQYSYNKLMAAQAAQAQRERKQALDRLSPNATDEERANAQTSYDTATAALNHWNAALEASQQGMQHFGDESGNFNSSMNAMGAAIDTAAEALDRLIQGFGRQIFNKAISEAKAFTTQFDTQMRTIQAITMKSDSEMATVRRQTIDRAIQLKTPVANVASVEADLYRQGLNDQQVEERTSAIIKFATVAGAKVTDAGKAITTAIQNGLVSSATEAMDVLVALGDTAATTAEQIFRGMQKSAAAAKVAGVSYEELTTLLTIGTSKTQLSGQVIGTGLQTIFSRMNRVTNQGLVNDQSGATTTINDVEAALKSAGVKLRNDDGKSFRNSFDVLRDLSKVWGNLTDIQRSNITYTMAGGRQMNVFQSLMEGMSEDGGAELERLLGMAENSEGTTENKYAISIKSVTAALDELKSTYDSLVNTIAGGNSIAPAIEGVTGIINGFNNLVSNGQSWVAGLAIIGAALVAFGVKAMVANAAVEGFGKGTLGVLGTILSLGAAAGIIAIAGGVGDMVEGASNNTEEARTKKQIESGNKFYEAQMKRTADEQKQIDKVRELGEAYERAEGQMKTEKAEALKSALEGLYTTLGGLSVGFDENGAVVLKWAEAVGEAQKKVTQLRLDAAKVADTAKFKEFSSNLETVFDENNYTVGLYENNGFNSRDIVQNSLTYASQFPGLFYSLAESDTVRNVIKGKTGREVFNDDVYTYLGSIGIAAEDQEKYIVTDENGDKKLNEDALIDYFAAKYLLDLNTQDPEEVYKHIEEAKGQKIENDSAIYLSSVFNWLKGFEGSTEYTEMLNNVGGDMSQIKPETYLEALQNYQQHSQSSSLSGAQINASEAKISTVESYLRNSSRLSYLFKDMDQKVFEGFISQAIKDINPGQYTDAGELANATEAYIGNAVSRYANKDTEFLNKTFNPYDSKYNSQITYTGKDGKTYTFGTEEYVDANDAERIQTLIDQHYNEMTSIDTDPMVSAVEGAGDSIVDAIGALAEVITGDETAKERYEALLSKGKETATTPQTDQTTSEPTMSSFVAPEGAIKIAAGSASDVGPGYKRPEAQAKQMTPQERLTNLYQQGIAAGFTPAELSEMGLNEALFNSLSISGWDANTFESFIGPIEKIIGERNTKLALKHALPYMSLDEMHEAGAIDDSLYTEAKRHRWTYADVYNRGLLNNTILSSEALSNVTSKITEKQEAGNAETRKKAEGAAKLHQMFDGLTDEQIEERKDLLPFLPAYKQLLIDEAFMAGAELKPMSSSVTPLDVDILKDDTERSRKRPEFIKALADKGITSYADFERGLDSQWIDGLLLDVLPAIGWTSKQLVDHGLLTQKQIDEGDYDAIRGVAEMLYGAFFSRKEHDETYGTTSTGISTYKDLQISQTPYDYKETDEPFVGKKDRIRTNSVKEKANEIKIAAAHEGFRRSQHAGATVAESLSIAQQASDAAEEIIEDTIEETLGTDGPVDLPKLGDLQLNEITRNLSDKFSVLSSVGEMLRAPEIIKEAVESVGESIGNMATDLVNGVVSLFTVPTAETDEDPELVSRRIKRSKELEAAKQIEDERLSTETYRTERKRGKQNTKDGLVKSEESGTSGNTLKQVETKERRSLEQIIEDATINGNVNNPDLSGLYSRLLTSSTNVSTLAELNDIIGENADDYEKLFSSNEKLRKIGESLRKGDGEYSIEDFREELRQGAAGTTLKTLMPQITGTAYTYDQQLAALTAVENGTATTEQMDLVAKQWGIDRNTLMNNKGAYTVLERNRLQGEAGAMGRSAATVFNKLFDFEENAENKAIFEALHPEISGGEARFRAFWTQYAGNNEEYKSMMDAYKQAGYTFEMNDQGQVTAKYNGKAVEENPLNPFDWNRRHVSRAQTLADINTVINGGELTGKNIEERKTLLKGYSSEVAQYLEMDDKLRESAEGQELLKKIKIQIEVDGLDNLVAVGELTQEAATAAKNLSAGGILRFDAMKSIRSQTYSNQQLGGLASASPTSFTKEMDQALMSQLGLTEAQYYSQDRTHWQNELQDYLGSDAFETSIVNAYEEEMKNAKSMKDRNEIRARYRTTYGLRGERDGGYSIDRNWYNNQNYQTVNSFKATQPIHTKSQVLEAAREIYGRQLSVEQADTQYKEYADELKSSYPELYEYLNTDNAARKAELETQIKLKFAVDGLADVKEFKTELESIKALAAELSASGTGEQRINALNAGFEDLQYRAYVYQQVDKVRKGEIGYQDVAPEVWKYVAGVVGAKNVETATDAQNYQDIYGTSLIDLLFNNSEGYRQEHEAALTALLQNGQITEEAVTALGGSVRRDKNIDVEGKATVTPRVVLDEDWFSGVNYTPKRKYTTDSVYSRAENMDMLRTIREQEMSLDAAQGIYEDQISQSSSLVKALQLEERRRQGKKVDQAEIDQLWEQAEKDFSSDPLAGQKAQLTTKELVSQVNDIVAAGEAGRDVFKGLDSTVQQQLMNLNGFSQFMLTLGENTEAATQAQKTLARTVLSETVKALEEEGKVIKGLSSDLDTIIYGNVVDSTKQINQTNADLVQMANIGEIYKRLTSGGITREQDWKDFASFFNIREEDLVKYRTGEKSLTADYGSRVTGTETLRADTAMQAAEQIIRASLKDEQLYETKEVEDVPTGFVDRLFYNLYTAAGGSKRMKTVKTEKSTDEIIAGFEGEQLTSINNQLEPFGLTIRDGELVSIDGGMADKPLTMQQRAAIASATRSSAENTSKAHDYRLLLQYGRGFKTRNFRGNMFEALERHAQQLAQGDNFTSDAAEQFFASQEYAELKENNDYEGLMARLFALENGQEASNPYNINSEEVQKYLTAAETGDYKTLAKFSEEKPLLKNYMQTIPGWFNIYSQYTTNQPVDEEELKAFKGERVYAELAEMERLGTIRKGTAQLGRTLTTGTEEEQRQAVNTAGSEIRSAANAKKIVNEMIENTDEITDAQWVALKATGEVGDTEIAYYRQHTDELDKLKTRLESKENDLSTALETALAKAFNLGSFDDIIADGNEQIKAAIEALLNLAGLQLNIDGENVDVGRLKDTRAGSVIVSEAADAVSGYGNKQTNAARRRQFYEIVFESGDATEFNAALDALGKENEWAKDADEWKKVLTEDQASLMMSMLNGGISYESFRNQIQQGSPYAPLYLNNSLFPVVDTLQQYAGDNFAYNPEFDREGFENFISTTQEGASFASSMNSLEYGAQVMRTFGENTDEANEYWRLFLNALSAKSIAQMEQWGDNTKEVSDAVSDLGKNSKTALSTTGQLINKMSKLNDQAYAASKAKGKSGSQLDSKALGVLSSATGIDQQAMKKMTKEEIDGLADMVESSANEEFLPIGQIVAERFQESVNQAIGSGKITLPQVLELSVDGQGTFDFAGIEALAKMMSDEELAALAAYAGKIATLTAKYSSSGEQITVENVLTSLLGGSGAGYKSAGGGGGGGGGKSAAQKLMEELKREQSLRNHEIKMIQFQETRYHNKDEYGNENAMIALENEAQKRLIKTLQDAIEKTKQQMAQTKKGSDDWNSLYDSVLNYEEAIEQATQAIEDNTKKMLENEKAILKTRTDLEQSVLKEIEARKQRERDMLDGTVSMQDIVLEAIRQRYRDEWELVKKDIEKKKEALEEEKSLIDERLQRRKDAEDEAEKYEELAEYKKQLALIQTDSTRTKDAAKLREKIAEIEKEIAWDAAQDEADYQKEQIDDQLEAYDDFLNYGEEDLESFLEDADNLSSEVTSVMQLNQEGLMQWLRENVKEYALAMTAAQQQMIQGWTDTYEQMLGKTHTYWDEINEILTGKQTWLEYMKQSQEYINASEDERKTMLIEWGEMYDKYVAAHLTGATYSHTDEQLAGTGTSGSGGGSGGGGGSGSGEYKVKYKPSGYIWGSSYASESDAKAAISAAAKRMGTNVGDYEIIKPANVTTPTTTSTTTPTTHTMATVGPDIPTTSTTAEGVIDEILHYIYSGGIKYASGGLVDYTGPAWVDGTPSKPEAFLSAEDTQMMRNWIESAKYVQYRSTVSNIDGSAFNGSSQNIGELIINITEAQFKDDADFDEVARRVGNQFVKELSKQGFHTMSYSF